ncbi:MAG: hypothetical protein WCQ95_06100 [Bacteroidota bacterium]
MKTINIKIDKKPITDQEIIDTKPAFTKVVKNFKGFKAPIYKSPWFIGLSSGVVLSTAAGFFLYFSPLTNKDSKATPSNQDSVQNTNLFVSNPILNKNIPYEIFTIDNKDGGNYQSISGSQINVPKNAFIHMDGTPVNNPVTVKYREMHDPYDFFISGVPMQYDSAGIEHTFESAGMLEIRAFDKDGELKLVPGKNLHIDMITYNDSPKFNLYYLDTLKRNWTYLDKNTCEKSNISSNNKSDYTYKYENNDINQSTDNSAFQFIVPQKSKMAKNTFKIDFDKKAFPEIGIYENVLFEVNTKKSKFDPKLFDIKWNEIKLKSSKTQGNYLMVLSRPDSSVYLYVYPVFASNDYAKAMATYNQQQELKKSAQAKNEQIREEAIAARKNLQNAKQSYNNNLLVQGTRGVTVNMMGYYNCDYPLPIQDYTFEPQFSNNDQILAPESIHAVDKSINAIFTILPGKEEIRCNRKSNIVLWVVSKDNKIGIVTNSEFKAATKNTRKPKFQIVLLETHEGLELIKNLIRI